MLRPIALTIAWLLAFPAAGLAQDKPDTAKKTCPTYDIDQLTELLKKETSCRAAVALFELCRFGASGDGTLSTTVIEKCEGDFLSTLNLGQKRSYRRAVKACDRKHRNDAGSMYRSFEAFCRTYIAREYSDAALRRRPK